MFFFKSDGYTDALHKLFSVCGRIGTGMRFSANAATMSSRLFMLRRCSFFGSVYDAFKVGIYRMHELSYSLSLAALFTNFFTYLILCLIARRMMNPLGMILLLVAQVVIIILMMYLMSHVYFFRSTRRGVCLRYLSTEIRTT